LQLTVDEAITLALRYSAWWRSALQ